MDGIPALGHHIPPSPPKTGGGCCDTRGDTGAPIGALARGTIVNLRAIARVDRDWRGEPVIALRDRDEKLAVSRTFAHRFKSM